MEKLSQSLIFSVFFSPLFLLMLIFTSYKPIESKKNTIRNHIQEEYIEKPLKSMGYLLLIIFIMTIALYTLL